MVGQLHHLARHGSCDVSLATSQVVQFLHEPKRSHELALTRIGRHLKGTLDKGLILRPMDIKAPQVDVCINAAFASSWGTKEGTIPDSVESRKGYTMEIVNCPALWVSKPQTSVARSTMESEHTALPVCLCAAIPLLAVLQSPTKTV